MRCSRLPLTLRAAIAGIALAASVCSPALAKGNGFYYLDPSQIDLTVLLPPPPNLGSPQALADEEKVAKTIAHSSSRQVETAEEERKRSVFAFTPVLGPDFTAQRLPLTTKFFSHVASDVRLLVDRAKAYWERPRPDGTVVKGSYPSGHAAFASSTAIILSQMVPAKRDAIFDQARQFAENRIILGVHFPTDVAAGWTAGTLAAYVMMQAPAFQRDFAAARAEVQRTVRQ
jgi:acid phosphatase (class A)